MCSLKKFIILAAVAASATAASAQLQLAINKTNLDFVRSAITPALRVVRTSYDVATKDFSERFGADGDSVFGRDYSLAVVTPAGLAMATSALQPWDFDPKYDYFRNDENLTTLINDCKASRLLPDADYVALEFDEFADPTPVPATFNESPINIVGVVNIDPSDCLSAFCPSETTSGLAIWASLPERKNIDTDTDLLLKIENASLEFDSVNNWAEIKKVNTNGNIIGGIFVVPQVTATGVIRFALAGFMAPPTGPNEPWRVIKACLPEADTELTATGSVTECETPRPSEPSKPAATDDVPESDI